MKKGLFLLMSLVALASCNVNFNGFDTNMIEPSGNVVTMEYKLQPFEEVKMNCAGFVEIVQSETKDGVVELTAPENYIELYKFESDGKNLNISFSKNKINLQTKDVKIRVYTTDLIKVQNSGVGSIEMDSLDTDHIEIMNSGVGSITINGVADDAVMTCSGVGGIYTGNLKAMNVKATVSGVGSIECYASDSIEGQVTGVGSLSFGGNPKNKNNKRTGIGSISEM